MFLMRAAAAALLSLWAVNAMAEDYPTRAITWVAPFPPGGITDTVARVISKAMSQELGKPIIIENRPGANSAVGTDYAMKAKPDGYTLLSGASGNLAANLYMYKNVTYDPIRDFEHIGSMSESIPVLVVSSNKPWKTVAEIVEYAKQNPGKLNYGSPGIGSGPHLAGVLFEKAAGITMTHVPYQGSGPEMVDLMSGVLDLAFDFPPVVRPYLQSGDFRPISVLSEKRLKTLPDVPTLTEAGYKDGVMTTWSVLVAPKGTPQPIVDKLSEALEKAMKSKEVVDFFDKAGSTITTPYLRGQALKDFIAAENVKWKDLVERSGAANQ